MTDDREETEIARLLRAAGQRREPPADIAQRVYARTADEWQRLGRKRQWTSSAWLAAAALAALASGLWLLRPLAPASVATVQWVQGPATYERGGRVTEMRKDVVLRAGDTIVSGTGSRVRLQLPDGSLLAIAANSRLFGQGSGSIALTRGRIYHDTDIARAARPLRIDTPFGVIEHVGTRYQVVVEEFGVATLVRSGRMQFTAPGVTQRVEAGQSLRADAIGRTWLQPADNVGADWDWVDQLSPGLRVEGLSLYEVLNRIAERAGLRLVFDPLGAASTARSITLHGPDVELAPLQAAQAVLASTTLQLRIENNKMIVSEVR